MKIINKKKLSLGLLCFYTATSFCAAADESCWQHKMTEKGSAENIATVCIDGNQAKMSIHYPNDGISPANCSQEGTANVNSNGTTSIEMGRGSCDNGRNLQANTLLCSSVNELLDCRLNTSERKFTFEPVVNELTTPGTSEIKSYYLKGYGLYELTLPDNWNDSVEQPTLDIPPTIRISPKLGNSFVVLITPIWPENSDVPLPTKKELAQTLGLSMELAQLQAVEQNIQMKEMNERGNFGYYFTATDSDPELGGYKFLNQGILAVGPIRVTFTILTNDGQDTVVRKALMMLQNSRNN